MMKIKIKEIRSHQSVSSKMRMMQKMMNTGCVAKELMSKRKSRIISFMISSMTILAKTIHQTTVATQFIIRVCSDCNTTKTPLWRSDPQGPKDKDAKQGKENAYKLEYMAQYKKPFKLPGSPQSGEKISFEDFALSKNSSFRRTFPKDEEEAAVLLMAFSCGLILS
ncbi:GATA transcription factor 16 [Camellia lanceoleosa]|uniref:GATA transcription factor 16 n=1 Tax=Camellia lanceoleosa TaxID=1840588 RepID=A0ACC0G357_9ERIC|nr:GATA transcription factor 16 [Camellia lanceoleosa]